MRIFNFFNLPISIKDLRSGGNEMNTSGGWLAALIGRMLKETDFNFACASYGNTRKVLTSIDDRIVCYTIPGRSEQNGLFMNRSLRICKRLVEEWEPDLIHIHGTESSYGLLTARGMLKYPTVISLQGLLGPCSEWYRYFGNSSLMDIIRMHRLLEIPALRGLWIRLWRMRRMAEREKEIIKGNCFFMGRTEWDKAYIKALNPTAIYYHEGRLLREAFGQNQWEIGNVQKHRIIFTHAGHPRKGTELLLDAVRLLISDYPDIKLYIAGNISKRSGYGRYLRKRLQGLGNHVVELGSLNAEQMVTDLMKSHVFVSPSFIDNSPNAVSEAQLIGMPVISTYTGGVPSLIQDGITGLFYSTGESHMLAAKIREVFENDELAVRLGCQARQVARKRHEPDSIVEEILANYMHVIAKKQTI